MHIAVPLPSPGSQPELWTPRAISSIAVAIENAGLDACSVSDHPFPKVSPGLPGHHAMDPFTLLAHVAASTTNLRLLTAAIVAPYRNPFLTASAVATLDHLSGGRVIVGVVAGYLKEEFMALGADFDHRIELTREHLDAMRAAWTQQTVSAQGRGWAASGNSLLPRPVSNPHPPLWVGGNSLAALRLAADKGDGWLPFETTAGRNTASTDLVGIADLGARIARLQEERGRAGRSGGIDVCYIPRAEWLTGPDDQVRERLEEMERIGVTWVVAGPRAASAEARHATGSRSLSELIEQIHAFGELVAQ